MIAPVTDEGVRQIQICIPSSNWYNYYTSLQYFYSKQLINISAPLDTIPILLGGGSIIPTQKYANNTKYSRLYFYSKFQWSSSKKQLTINVIENNYSHMSNLILDTITIYGLKYIPIPINLNNKQFNPKIRPFT
ncbi:unnamed protein product [Rotaria sordida]|uniref:Glycosyl hydrolase family 31 C-terminal domain-containing protein n=1 Tax=Rotaria sordida TaxID=392033 RepID=A0A813YRA1_9BILA|nr:unnamed protein product [Rotaria sordida]CAF1390169.1 unnamed protein product [Rotaria sordida]